VQHHGDGLQLDELGHAFGGEVRLGRVEPVRRAHRGGEGVDAGGLDELARDLDRVDLARLVGADVVLDAQHRLDLALDLRAVLARLGDHLGGLAGVLVDVQVRAVEEHGVPPGA